MTPPHALESEHVRGQLALRVLPANPRPVRGDGEYLQYWMQSTHRLEENWALQWLIHLTDKRALDGRDPSSYGGIQWCFGKFDRPWGERPVWGTIRSMSLARAYSKFDARTYERRWTG